MHRFLRPFLALSFIALASTAQAAGLSALEASWVDAKYHTTDKKAQGQKLDALVAQAHAITAEAQNPEAKVWEAVMLASRAKFIGGTSALDDVRAAKNLLESAIPANPPSVADGYAHALLGGLYGKVPGWPISFGDHGKAREHFNKALALNPGSIDVNTLYAEYLVDQDKPNEARAAVEKALAAPARKDREAADAGRREEANALLKKIDG